MKIAKNNFELIVKSLGYEVEPEFKFCKTRKFRADWKVSKNGLECLVEYEGMPLVWKRSPKTGKMEKKSRHVTPTGFTKDCEKYNLAQILGYQVLRYTVINFDNVIDDLEDCLSLN